MAFSMAMLAWLEMNMTMNAHMFLVVEKAVRIQSELLSADKTKMLDLICRNHPPKILKSLESLAHLLTKILHTRPEPV